MRVLIPTPLRSYTSQSWVEAEGDTVGTVLADLDRRYPGIRFRMIDEQDQIRPHIKLFINAALERSLAAPLREPDGLIIVAALSGG